MIIPNETIKFPELNVSEILKYCGTKACITPNYELMLWFNFIFLFILFFEIPEIFRTRINFDGLSKREYQFLSFVLSDSFYIRNLFYGNLFIILWNIFTVIGLL